MADLQHWSALLASTDQQLQQMERDGWGCNCGECFACYVKVRAGMHGRGRWRAPTPPGSVGLWSRWDWIKYIDSAGIWGVEPIGAHEEESE